MGNQMTEMLKGTLEGIVLAILAARPAYGYEITARLREQGFADIVEGTVYALLVRIEQRGFVDVEKVPSEKGPPRKVYSLNAQGREQLEEFWRTWSFLSERIEQLHQPTTRRRRREVIMAAKWIEIPHRLARRQEGSTGSTRPASRRCPSRTARPRRPSSATSCTTAASPTATRRHDHDAQRLRRPVGARRRRRDAGRRHRRRRPGRFAEAFAAAYAGKRWIDKERARLTETIRRTRAGRSRTMTTARCRHPGERPGEVLQGPARPARRRLRRRAGQHLRAARLERRRQDHGREDPVHAAQAGRRHRHA